MLGLAQFAIRDQDREKKLEFIFSIYDMDRDGFISNGELFQASRRMKRPFVILFSGATCNIEVILFKRTMKRQIIWQIVESWSIM